MMNKNTPMIPSPSLPFLKKSFDMCLTRQLWKKPGKDVPPTSGNRAMSRAALDDSSACGAFLHAGRCRGLRGAADWIGVDRLAVSRYRYSFVGRSDGVVGLMGKKEESNRRCRRRYEHDSKSHTDFFGNGPMVMGDLWKGRVSLCCGVLRMDVMVRCCCGDVSGVQRSAAVVVDGPFGPVVEGRQAGRHGGDGWTDTRTDGSITRTWAPVFTMGRWTGWNRWTVVWTFDEICKMSPSTKPRALDQESPDTDVEPLTLYQSAASI
ncbi:hypothetical protein IWZ00DRAFT_328454 [Phyllosticta capitalensis]